MGSGVLMSYYDVLGIDQSADAKEIKIAHRQKAEIYHPDKVHHLGKDQQKAAEMEMKLINNARDILLDPDQRALYDQYLNGALEAEEVLEAFIIVETEMEEERSPLWKTAMKTFGQRWEKRMENIKRRTGLGTEQGNLNLMEAEEVVEAEEVLEVEPIAELDEQGFSVIRVEPEGKEKTKKKKKKKVSSFDVVGVVDGSEGPDTDDDFLE